jgi:putative flippase GtrA
VAVEATVIHNFLWHEHWTWVDRARLAPGGRWIRLLRFNLATGSVSIAGNLVLMRLYAGALDIATPLAALFSIASCWLVNFTATNTLVFSERTRCESPPGHH